MTAPRDPMPASAEEPVLSPELADPHADPTTDPPAPVVRGGRGAPRNVANPATNAREAQRAAKLLAQRKQDLRTLLEQPAFRRIAWWLIGTAGVFDRPRTYSAEIHVLQGRAEMGLLLWKAIEDVHPQALLEMMQASKHQEL